MVRDPFQRLASWLLMFKRALPSRKYERFYRVWMSALRKSQYSKRERFDSLVIRRLMRKERYISSFLYAEVLLHWIAGISTDRILVLDHYDLEERPLEVMRMIESYLSLPPHHYDDSDLLSVSVNTGVAPEDDDGRLLADQKEKRSGSQSSNLRLLSQSLNLSHFFSSSGDGNTTRANPIHPPYVITDTQLLALSRHLFWPSLCLFERVFGWSIHITTESEL